MKKVFIIFLAMFSSTLIANSKIDRDVLRKFKPSSYQSVPKNQLSLIIFLHPNTNKNQFLKDIRQIPSLRFQDLGFMPAVALSIPLELNLLEKLAKHPAVAQISSNNPGRSELDINVQAIKLAPSVHYPEVSNWWAHGYTGHQGVIGLLDDGIDPNHPAFANKRLVIRKEGGSQFFDFLNGVRTAHGTGVACIYASNDKYYTGIAFDASTIVSGLSGLETADTQNILLTLGSLDWMLQRSEIKPTVINYSIGNGSLSCPDCPEWSGLAKVIDYTVNQEKILWVKSAGNGGDIKPTNKIPYATTLTVPADNYNALSVANMSTTITENNQNLKTALRDRHRIYYTSSRGPTPFGRRKPDLTAPGYNTRTCAPDPDFYHFYYTAPMDYHNGFRLMGGTSAAAPHVGASVLLLQDAGIQDPMAIKALLINSADTWTDEGKTDSKEESNHFPVLGSEWNRTYGWGYLNMEAAFEQRLNLVENRLTLENSVHEYQTLLDVGDKITLVHERRVGHFPDSAEWKLSHLSLELINLDNQELIAIDNSPIDTVHQVANCNRLPGEKLCSNKNHRIRALVRVRLLSTQIDGSNNEPYALLLKTQK